MKYIMLFVFLPYLFAFEQNCTAYNILNNKINSCQNNNISCYVLIYTIEFNKCSFSLTNIKTQPNTTCILLNQCRTSCKSSTSNLLLSNCYKNCFTVTYKCSPVKKIALIVTINSSYKTTTYEIVLVSIILIWFVFIVIKYTYCHNSFNYKNKVHVTTFTNV